MAYRLKRLGKRRSEGEANRRESRADRRAIDRALEMARPDRRVHIPTGEPVTLAPPSGNELALMGMLAAGLINRRRR